MYSLAINIADLRRRFILFCGAGISRDASIPTASDILIDLKKRIYQQEIKRVSFDEGEFKKWISENKQYEKMGYSESLDHLFPGIEQRRVYLNSFFEGKEPGEVHRLIAKLVKIGVFRFIITTNFDNLIEKALDEEGLKDRYSVISTDDQAKHSDSWDKVETCRIYKLHGDKDQGLIRNTISELDNLGEHLKKDFQELIDRHGVIVIGYRGADAGVMKCFENREFLRYPMFWQHRSTANEKVKQIMQRQDGRLIKFDSASKFLADLLDRIQVIHKSSIEGDLEIISDRVKRILTLPNAKEILVKLQDERKIYMDAVKSVYGSLINPSWQDLWESYVDLFEKAKSNMEFAEHLLKLEMLNEWNEFIKLFEEIYSLNESGERYGRDGLINQLFYSLLLLIGSRALKYDKFIFIKKLFSVKKLTREKYSSILDWNVIGNFIEERNKQAEKQYYVARFSFFLDIAENKKVLPRDEIFERMKFNIVDFDLLCFIYTVRHPNSSYFPYWYPSCAYFFDYRSAEFLKKLKFDENYLKNIALDLFEMKPEEFISFLKDKAIPSYSELVRQMPGFTSNSPFKVLFEK